MPLEERDHRLSMRISPRSPHDERNQGLRSLLIHRLAAGSKAVLRRSHQKGHLAVYCEPCQNWYRVREVGADWHCRCGRRYVAELVVYAVRHEPQPAESGPRPADGATTDVTFLS